jgi:hypothetical protein
MKNSNIKWVLFVVDKARRRRAKGETEREMNMVKVLYTHG